MRDAITFADTVQPEAFHSRWRRIRRMNSVMRIVSAPFRLVGRLLLRVGRLISGRPRRR